MFVIGIHVHNNVDLCHDPTSGPIGSREISYF